MPSDSSFLFSSQTLSLENRVWWPYTYPQGRSKTLWVGAVTDTQSQYLSTDALATAPSKPIKSYQW